MKKLTFNDIKEFCKEHYGEYMRETETAIVFSFFDQGFTRKITFLELAGSAGPDLDGMWQYVDCNMFGKNKYIFNFKRTA